MQAPDTRREGQYRKLLKEHSIQVEVTWKEDAIGGISKLLREGSRFSMALGEYVALTKVLEDNSWEGDYNRTFTLGFESWAMMTFVIVKLHDFIEKSEILNELIT